MQQQLSRRTVLETTGSLGLGIATGSIFVGNAAAGDHKFAHQLNTVREATRKYRDVNIAKDAGYGFFEIVPHAGIVYANLDHLVDFDDADELEHTDPPTLLFYAPSEDVEDEEDVNESTIVLAGLEWLVSGRHEDFDADIFDDDNSARNLKVTEEDGWHVAPGGLPFTGLHAWVHLSNPSGVFARDHPVMIERLTD